MSPLISTLLWNTILAGGLATVVYLLQRFEWLKSRPGLLHCLWLLVLLKLVFPPIYTIPVSLGSRTAEVIAERSTIPSNLVRVDDVGGVLFIVVLVDADEYDQSLVDASDDFSCDGDGSARYALN